MSFTEQNYWKGRRYRGDGTAIVSREVRTIYRNARTRASQGLCEGCGRHLTYKDHHPTRAGYCRWGECLES